MSECLLVDGPRVLVTPGRPRGPSMAALDKLTGRTLWTTEAPGRPPATMRRPLLPLRPGGQSRPRARRPTGSASTPTRRPLRRRCRCPAPYGVNVAGPRVPRRPHPLEITPYVDGYPRSPPAAGLGEPAFGCKRIGTPRWTPAPAPCLAARRCALRQRLQEAQILACAWIGCRAPPARPVPRA